MNNAVARTGAVVVLYHPDLDLLVRALAGIAHEASWVCVVDNTPDSTAEVFLRRAGYSGRYLHMKDNVGIATAQNMGIHECLGAGCTHLLLVDQDSLLPAGALSLLMEAEQSLLEAGQAVAAVGPVFLDELNGKRSSGIRHRWFRAERVPIPIARTEPVESDYIISSGSLIRAEVLGKVGLFRDDLFIDWVDAEWCLRARGFGYRSFIVPAVTMVHRIGDARAELFGRDIRLHSAPRDYYFVRNGCRLLMERQAGWRFRSTLISEIVKYALVHAWLSQHRRKSFLDMVKAIREGLAGTMRKYSEI